MQRAIAATFALLIASPAGAAPAFDIPPYLFFDPGSSLQVAWRPVDDAARGIVELFKDGAPWQRVQAERDDDLFRALLVVPCDVDGDIAYRVEGMTSPARLQRPHCAREQTTVRFSFLTDTQMDTAIAREAAQRVAARDGDFVLHGGDHVQSGGSEEQWTEYLRSIEPFASRSPLVPAAGNHEFFFDADGDNLAKYFAQSRERSWFRFSSGPVDIFVLNSAVLRDRELCLDQLAWLREELGRDARGRWRIVVFHHPPFSLGIGHAPFVWAPGRAELRKYYVPLLEEAGVDLVLNGHTHLFERSFKDGVHYLVGGPTGGIMGWFGGDNPFATFAHEARTVSHFTVSPDSLVVVTEDLNGNLLDELTLRR
jgi:predicted phosphodiesterase